MTPPRPSPRPPGARNGASPDPAGDLENDAQLLARIARGELEGLGTLFDRHAADLHRFLSRAAPRDEPDELVQETFLRVVRIASSFDGRSSSARSWLFGVGHSIVRERRRSFARFARAIASLGQARAESTALPSSGARFELERALASLDDDKREVVVLCEGLGLTGPEAAEILGIPVGTVWTRLHHARAALRRIEEATP